MVKAYTPSTLPDALKALADGGYTPYAGGTDLMIKAPEGASYLFLHKLKELKRVYVQGGYVHVGAGCTFGELMLNPAVPAILREAAGQVAAPAIRNLATIGGNIANASPKADSAVVCVAAGARLVLRSERGERTALLKDCYLGRNKLDICSEELIVELLLPAKGLENYYYKKVGARAALAIARASFAGIMQVEKGVIVRCATAFGAISDVILCREDLDGLFSGKTLSQAKAVKAEFLAGYDAGIKPIKGRISAEYRKDVCMNLLGDFLERMGI